MTKRLESRLARLESRMQATSEVVTIVVVEDTEWYPVRAERIPLLNDSESLDRIRQQAMREDMQAEQDGRHENSEGNDDDAQDQVGQAGNDAA